MRFFLIFQCNTLIWQSLNEAFCVFLCYHLALTSILCSHLSLISFVQVSTAKMHLFTLVQLLCLAVLWMVKMSPFSLALPFILILTIPLRMFMTGTIFTVREMKCVSIYPLHSPWGWFLSLTCHLLWTYYLTFRLLCCNCARFCCSLMQMMPKSFWTRNLGRMYTMSPRCHEQHHSIH